MPNYWLSVFLMSIVKCLIALQQLLISVCCIFTVQREPFPAKVSSQPAFQVAIDEEEWE